jgi:hypothetical protein
MKSKMPYILTGLSILAEFFVIAVCVFLAIFTPKEETALRCILYAFIIWHLFLDPTGLFQMFTPKKLKERFQSLKNSFS